ncbi:hypothetical protein IGI04_006710, partial [Brassica rapa subsp. trilocularis]
MHILLYYPHLPQILDAWRRFMCEKQVISLVETMKSVFSQSCRRLTWKSSGQCRDDLHGSRPSLFVKKNLTYIRLTWKSSQTTYTEVVRLTPSYTEVVRPTTYIEVFQDFIPSFWSNLAYLGPTTYIEVVQDFIPRLWPNLTYLGRVLCKLSDGRLS